MQLAGRKLSRIAAVLFQQLIVARRPVWTQREVQVIALADRALHSFFGPCTNPDRRMGLLDRFGLDMHVFDLGKLAFESNGVFCPQTPEQVEPFPQTSRALWAGHTKAGEFIDPITLSDSEIEPPVGEVVNERHVFGHPDRMVEGEQQHKRANPNAFGPRRNSSRGV